MRTFQTFASAALQGSNDEHWAISKGDKTVGRVTSAVYSPRLEANIALAMVARDHADIGNKLTIHMDGKIRGCEIVPKPLYDLKKSIPAKT